MRAHVEIIDQRDYIWHLAEFVHAQGTAKQKNLSYDEEDGSLSAKIVFTSDWGRPAGVHHAETEWWVEKGQVQLGDRVLGPGDYCFVIQQTSAVTTSYALEFILDGGLPARPSTWGVIKRLYR